jgi:hypothetical protein
LKEEKSRTRARIRIRAAAAKLSTIKQQQFWLFTVVTRGFLFQKYFCKECFERKVSGVQVV